MSNDKDTKAIMPPEQRAAARERCDAADHRAKVERERDEALAGAAKLRGALEACMGHLPGGREAIVEILSGGTVPEWHRAKTLGIAALASDAGKRAAEEIADLRMRAVNGCPCSFSAVTPCREHCTCHNSLMSGGCDRCARYGSKEQREKAAIAIAEELAVLREIASRIPLHYGECRMNWNVAGGCDCGLDALRKRLEEVRRG